MQNNDFKQQVEGLVLSQYWDLCYQAHSNTSFSPEKRATMYVKEYSAILEEDLKELGENTGNYKEKFINHFTNWMHAKSRCLSSMITGPANFPVRRAQKANASEHNRYTDFMTWRDKYFKAVNRVPTKSPEEELYLAERKLEAQLNFQFQLKEINKLIRKSKAQDLKELLNELQASDKEFTTEELSCISDNYGRGYKVPGYTLTNLNARIKSTKEKIVIMTNRINRKKEWEDINFDGGYVTIEDDRVKIFHEQKPEREIITEIKSSGFRWSPFWKCWCRKHTGNAIYSMKNLSFIKGV